AALERGLAAAVAAKNDAAVQAQELAASLKIDQVASQCRAGHAEPALHFGDGKPRLASQVLEDVGLPRLNKHEPS
ncbi:MAG: hypothetical protein WD468_08435, partial [Pirellulales bacterium]